MTFSAGGIAAVILSVLLLVGAAPPQFEIDAAALANSGQAARLMPELAERVLAALAIPDAETRIRLEVAAGDRAAARSTLARLSDLAALRVAFALTPRPGDHSRWQAELDKIKTKSSLSASDAFELIDAYAPQSPSAAQIVREDANRRYAVQDRVLIKTKDGATLSAVVVRKRGITTRLPAAFVFTIYADPASDALRAEYAAARGFAGVTAYTRGKGYSTDRIVPYEYDGRDADSVISWIARQPWSNGKVGMYGGSYNGFTQWAAAKYCNSALKTIVPYVANNPGNGLPMENNIFLFVNYPWIYYVTDNKFMDDAAYDDPAFRGLNFRWYRSGRSYRDIPRIAARPNPWLERWLRHPSYDAYWQAMVPYKSDFSRITIPVLTVTGYYDDGQGSALNFLKDHYAYNKRAVHYLVIGPYDHFGSQRAHKDDVLRGYTIDPVAQFSTPQLTFDWLDWIMRGGKKPSMLRDRVNYEVMGANVWRHAPSIAAMANAKLTFYLTKERTGKTFYKLSRVKPPAASFLTQQVNLNDRKTVDNNDYYPFPIVGAKPDFSRGFSYISAPFDKPVEIDGFFTGKLQVIVNKRDMDLGVILYEVRPNGTLMHLSYFMGRASYTNDISTRRLLTPGTIETIAFDRSRLISRRMEKGSRLLVTLDVNKNAFAQVNYGTGKDVSTEDVRDGKVPLQIRWLTGSYVTIPIRQ